MAHQKRDAPELPAEAYQLAEMYRLGQPLNLYRANFTNGLVYIYRKASNTRVVFWEQIAEVEGPPGTTSLRGRRPSLIWISLDLLFGPGTWITSRRGIRSSAIHFYCILHLKDGSRIAFSQAITNLPGLEDDIRAHLRRLHGR